MIGRDDIEFDVIFDLVDHPVVAIEIWTRNGDLQIIAEVSEQGRRLVLAKTSVQSEHLGPNSLGAAVLRRIAQRAMERLDYDEIVVEGSVRNTGAGPGRTPKPIRFARRHRP